MSGLIAEGKRTALETVVVGFEQLPTSTTCSWKASGKNVGKLVVKTSG
jgi:NADPH-dependent curcumin reductase CurA